MIPRDIEPRLKLLAKQFPAIVLTGPRQSGKSTLCKAVFTHLPYTTLESPDVRAFAAEDPRGFLAQFPRGAILDEIQNGPKLVSYLQEVIDRDPAPGKWILTGSHNLSVMASTSQSLAGRAAVLHLLPLARSEVLRFDGAPAGLDESLLMGGYPRILDRRLNPSDWLASYVATYLERDIRTITNVGNLGSFQRFMQLCAGRTSQLLNLSALGADVGVSQPTIRAWISILEASFIVFRVPGYHGNAVKGLVKMPKLHFYDSGLVCWLLGIRDLGHLKVHPLRGAIFESWVVSEIVKARMNGGELDGIYFYRDKKGLECDALVRTGTSLTLVEAKAGQTVSSDMAASLERIQERLAGQYPSTARMVIYGGNERQKRREVQYVSWNAIQDNRWL